MPHQPICSIPDCTKPHYGRGWCKAHYERWRLYGTTAGKPKIHSLDRLHERIRIDQNGCWIWLGSLNWAGYGQVGVKNSRKLDMAHRAVYKHLRGPIADGLELDHLCRVPACVNPEHLEPVTPAVNKARSIGSAVDLRRATTCCPKGHPYSGDNLYVNPKGSRECRTCRAQRR